MMSQTIRRIAVATAVALIFVVGCGQGAPAVDTGDEEVTVKGTVKVKGKNATKGEVVFDPSNVERKTGPKTAPIEKDGTYSIKTLIGKNQVTVRSPEVNRDPVLGRKQFEFDAKSGENTYDIDLQ